MNGRLAKSLTVLVLVLSLGLNWGLLQSVAWVSMIVTYSRQSTFRDALVKTFDGRHPCSLCRLASDAKRSEQQQQKTVAPEKEVDFFLEVPVDYCFWTLARESATPADLFGLARAEPPPIPPPRAG